MAKEVLLLGRRYLLRQQQVQEAGTGGSDVFVYKGGEQAVPDDIRSVRIHKSITVIPAYAFACRQKLTYVEFHEGVERIGSKAFMSCISLRSPRKLPGDTIIDFGAFWNCISLRKE